LADRPLAPHDVERHLILGLTVRNPWAWGLAKAIKPLENRTWAPPKVCLGRYIAIHAGKTLDAEDGIAAFRDCLNHPLVKPKVLERLGDDGHVSLAMMPMASVLGVGRLAKVVEDPDELTPEQRVWWAGPRVRTPGQPHFGWLFDDVVEFPPVPCRGFQKLWALPRDVLDLVRPRYLAARAARKVA
jgi:hypothetical protein